MFSKRAGPGMTWLLAQEYADDAGDSMFNLQVFAAAVV